MTYMKTLSKLLASAAVLAAVSSGQAYAAGTAAGTNVQNTFTLNYEVDNVAQPEIDNTATPTEFTVDRVVDLTVASTGDTNVAPGAVGEDLVYTITNNGNDTQAYVLSLANGVDGTDDDFDPTAFTITYSVDGGPVQTYTVGSGDATLDVPADSVVTVTVTSNIPAGVNDADTADVILIADTAEPSTSPNAGDEVLADTGGNTLTGAAENVLADAAGDNDAAGAGDHSATGMYIVASPNLTGEKTVSIFSQDGSGCVTVPGTPAGGDQFAIPGACVEYVITAENTGATADATNIAIVDTLPGDLEYVTAVQAGFTGGSLAQPSSGTDCVSNGCVVNLTGATLGAGVTGTITIRAIVK